MQKETTDPNDIEKLQTCSVKETEGISVDVPEQKPSEDDRWKYIIGFVTGIRKDNNTRYVACNLTYPGADAIIWCSKNHSVNIGDWVEAKVSKSDFAKYFPPNPRPTTPKADIKFWKQIEAPKNYSVVRSAEGLQVKIKNFQVPNNHKCGNPMKDQFLGLVDASKHIPTGTNFVDLLIKHRQVFKASNGYYSCWSVKRSEKSVQASGQAASSSESLIAEKENKAKIKRKTKLQQNYSNKSNKPPVLAEATSLPSSSGLQSHDQVSEQVAQSSISDENEKNEASLSVMKRAVVTSFRSINKRSKKGENQIAFLWLLDDHQKAVLLSSGTVIQEKKGIPTKLHLGYFFEGLFQQEKSGKWMCTKHIRKLGKLLEYTEYNNQLELQFVTDNIEPVSIDRFKRETYHCFIGKIIDVDDKLPTDVSSGVKINIKFSYISSRADWFWIVAKVHKSSKHVQLLTEFHDAWHSPGVRDLIRQKCLKEFVKLYELMDISADEVSTNVQKQNDSKVSNKKNWKFAWVVEHSEDIVRMVVFPRFDEQEIRGTKKNVTNKNVYRSVYNIELHKLYKVNIADNEEVVDMIDCPQWFHADESGDIEFKFVSCNSVLLARNVAIVNPIGVPKWLGKLMFAHTRPIGSSKKLMKTTFRLLDDEDLFANENVSREHGVFFVNTGSSVEKFSKEHLDEVLQNELKFTEEEMYEHNLFKTKLLNLHPSQEVFPMFQAVCSVFKNRQVVDEMKLRGIDIDDLMQLQSSIRY